MSEVAFNRVTRRYPYGKFIEVDPSLWEAWSRDFKSDVIEFYCYSAPNFHMMIFFRLKHARDSSGAPLLGRLDLTLGPITRKGEKVVNSEYWMMRFHRAKRWAPTGAVETTMYPWTLPALVRAAHSFGLRFGT
jgi:hypothetical protein